MSIVFKSEANYQRVINIWTKNPVTVQLDNDGRFTITSNVDRSVILDTQLSEVQRIYDYFYAIIITVNDKQYKLNFSKPVNIFMSIIFRGWYNWVAPHTNNPLSGVRQQWIQVFEQQGMRITRDGDNISLARIGVAVAVSILIIVFFYRVIRF